MIDHDDHCSVLLPGGKCNCKGGKIETHVHSLVPSIAGDWLLCAAAGCYYAVPLTVPPKEEPEK